jgi:5-methylcytosine-specific restriction endonuclease McrA
MIPISKYIKIGKKCPHKYSTVVPACETCNMSKGDKTPLEFFWKNEQDKNGFIIKNKQKGEIRWEMKRRKVLKLRI